ncbi:MAG: hypothetical protein NTX52_15680 [Planctomycetota bacterium]|nr:hypothetical protein [Planctomycetota bacterium]
MAGKHGDPEAGFGAKPRADAWGSDKQKPAFLRPGFVVELPSFGLAYAEAGAAVYATSSIFVRIYEICGQIFTKTIDRRLLVVYNSAVFV